LRASLAACLYGLLISCGTSSPTPTTGSALWSAASLQTVILAPGSFPVSFTAQPDYQGSGGIYDLSRMQMNTPPGELRQALTSDHFSVGYRRNWHETPVGVGYVELLAFASDGDASNFQQVFAHFLSTSGLVPIASAVIPGGSDFTTHGPGGMAYSVVAERNGVVVQVAIGGPGTSIAIAEALAGKQLASVVNEAHVG
jgi:hypothetical protein